MTAPNCPTQGAAAIAAGLSEAERALLNRPFGMTTHPFYAGRSHKACRALVAVGVLTEHMDSIGNPLFRFTALGLAVRAALQDAAK
jgi:hypothetical protein